MTAATSENPLEMSVIVGTIDEDKQFPPYKDDKTPQLKANHLELAARFRLT